MTCVPVAVGYALSLYARRNGGRLATDKTDGKDLSSNVKYLVRTKECGLRLSSNTSSADICDTCSFVLSLFV